MIYINFTDSFSVDGGNLKWIYVNKDHKGYYRVQYSENNWNALANQLLENHKVYI